MEESEVWMFSLSFVPILDDLDVNNFDSTHFISVEFSWTDTPGDCRGAQER
jgi:hypothetical protein